MRVYPPVAATEEGWHGAMHTEVAGSFDLVDIAHAWMPMRQRDRWIALAATLLLALTAARWSGREDRAAASASAIAEAVPRVERDAASTTVRELDLDRLSGRQPAHPAEDPFRARSWQPEEESRKNAPPSPPPAPQAPPLPFAYLGKLVEGGRVAVFLTQGDRNHVVRAGDTLEGAWRVDDISEHTLSLTYLPLGQQRSLAVGTPESTAGRAALLAPTTATAAETPRLAPAGEPIGLLWVAPAQVTAGREFAVSVGLPPGADARSARIEIAYDSSLVQPLGRSATGPGRVALDAPGPGGSGGWAAPVELRFRVLAAAPSSTQLRVASAAAVSGAGLPAPVRIPPAHTLAIVTR